MRAGGCQFCQADLYYFHAISIFGVKQFGELLGQPSEGFLFMFREIRGLTWWRQICD